jgi:hypothetical protein
MKTVELNFKLPKEAYAVRELNGKFYVDNINGNFNHKFWEEISFMPKSELEVHHPSFFFETEGDAIMHSEIAKIDHAIYKVKDMRSGRNINREQYQDVMKKLTAMRECLVDEA